MIFYFKYTGGRPFRNTPFSQHCPLFVFPGVLHFNFLVLNAASKQVKKIGLFAYRPIIPLAMIIIGGCILFDARGHTNNTYTGLTFWYDSITYPPRSEILDSTILGLLYVFAGLFILFLFIFAIWFSLNRFRKLKIPKLYSRTSIGSLETLNGSKYTPFIFDV